jgi:hypothetical protein
MLHLPTPAYRGKFYGIVYSETGSGFIDKADMSSPGLVHG